ncbi:AtpZ/AtpI family protein [Thiomicrorhabdus sp. ZW0627]|uniref:AtpZ/AtpI family protein n=1 Tax=Thiomicrorhabdus sp. ZW0627 TaxID=3039774 RepID=UPI0024367949|nr:AtpZ/AtpI family protein [Thiomicrorhabdus sp. ZW0627]MDG6773826.1 AtpZ/AtpI family protein [Thiomicrorhabdus sp. ZW0627]
MTDEERLEERIEDQVRRIKKAETERPTLLAQTIYLGVLGLLFVIPVIGGAYLGNWLDSLELGDYSFSWTISLILSGVFIGAMNVILFIKRV